MNETVKCSECGGSKCQNISGNTYRCLYCGATFATQAVSTSAPVTTPAAPQPQVIYINQPAPEAQPYQAPVMRSHKEKSTALLLTFFLGGLGIEWFYLGNTAMGVLSLLFCWTGIPALIALVHFIILLCTSSEEFNRKYNY